ncbi:unnamed protein product [Prorocentrum cordatum]|uniref:Uncharacterized protein n=1 Tax=Prorocentrum cordatum TaxID=2364126 RepID=A0ABN9PS66_9DINO|nr:unnamed protein product [Polarella glacialis]
MKRRPLPDARHGRRYTSRWPPARTEARPSPSAGHRNSSRRGPLRVLGAALFEARPSSSACATSTADGPTQADAPCPRGAASVHPQELRGPPPLRARADCHLPADHPGAGRRSSAGRRLRRPRLAASVHRAEGHPEPARVAEPRRARPRRSQLSHACRSQRCHESKTAQNQRRSPSRGRPALGARSSLTRADPSTVVDRRRPMRRHPERLPARWGAAAECPST